MGSLYDSLEAIREEALTEGRQEGRQEGREEGMAEAILALLQGRRILVDDTLETRVRACRNRNTPNSWLLRAARVERGEQLFDAP